MKHACLSGGKVWQTCSNRCGGTVKDVQACLSARKAIEISFHNCGGHMKLLCKRNNGVVVSKSSCW